MGTPTLFMPTLGYQKVRTTSSVDVYITFTHNNVGAYSLFFSSFCSTWTRNQANLQLLFSLSKDGLCFIWHRSYCLAIACLVLISQTVEGIFWCFSFISGDELLKSDLFLSLLALLHFQCDVRKTFYCIEKELDLISYLLGSSSFQLNVIIFVAFVFYWGKEWNSCASRRQCACYKNIYSICCNIYSMAERLSKLISTRIW